MSLDEFLTATCATLGKDAIDAQSYTQYLRSNEWIETVEQLKRVVMDLSLLPTLRLPAMLKAKLYDTLVASVATSAQAIDATVPVGGGWTKAVDEASGVPYYIHTVTGESQWERPEDFVDVDDEIVLPAGHQEAATETLHVGDESATSTDSSVVPSSPAPDAEMISRLSEMVC